MPKIEWLGTPIGCPCFFSQVPSLVPEPDEPDTVGQVRLRSPSQGLVPLQQMFRFPKPQLLLPPHRTPQLREPPGQWTFAVSVGGRMIGTCGPARMDTINAQPSAKAVYNAIIYAQYAFQECPDVLSRARDAYQRTRDAVVIGVRRNGVFRFSYPLVSRELAGLPESQQQEEEQVEPDTVGQLVLRSPSQGLVPGGALRTPYPAPRAPQLRSPSQERTRPCTGTMSMNEGHVHYIYRFAALSITPVPGVTLDISFAPASYGTVQISWQDVRAGVAKSYVTTEQNGHTHTLLLSAGDLAGLHAGKTLTKQTSRDARPGGRQHTHTVTISCRA